MMLQRLRQSSYLPALGLMLLTLFTLNAHALRCEYQLAHNWGSGFSGNIIVTNDGETTIDGWQVDWLINGGQLSASWNAQINGTNPYSAVDMGWNAQLTPGQSAELGLQASGADAVVTILSCNAVGDVEIPTSSSSEISHSSSPVSSALASSSQQSRSLQSRSSENASSIAASQASASDSPCEEHCNWYGETRPLCVNQNSGWGWENNQSCIGASTCNNQWGDGGVVSNCQTSSDAANLSSTASTAISSVISTSSVASQSSMAGSSVPNEIQNIAQQMGIGWNLGNSLEAVGGETAWGNPMVTQQLISSVKSAGFNTLRIPVAWSQFSDSANFVIDEGWKNRVEDVVNYALNEDMYVIINNHWDGGWMQPTYAEEDYVNHRLAMMWEQIATHFQDYGNHLLFAGTNEVMVDGDYGTPTEEYYSVQNGFNQTFVNTVRATGGNNANRVLVVQGFNTNIDHAVNFAEIPSDTVSDRLMMEIHYYDPYNFTLNTSSNITQWGAIATDPNATETWADESWTDAQFQKMQTHFSDNGVPVILGEYGVVSRLNVTDHEKYRTYWNEYITQSAVAHGIVPVYWDNGFAGDGGLALFDRNSGDQLYPDIIDALMKAKK